MILISTTPRTLPIEEATAFANQFVYDHQPASRWHGVLMDKCAQDLLAYQEIIFALRPDIIVETGTWCGGSALFFAEMCELAGNGQVLSIDREPLGEYDPREGRYVRGNHGIDLPRHPRLYYLLGDTAAPSTIKVIHRWAADQKGMVVLDSDHHKPHVLAELDAYAGLVAPGHFLIVEDTNINGHPVRLDFGDGPWEALEVWLPHNPSFEVDTLAQPCITSAPNGYLRRIV